MDNQKEASIDRLNSSDESPIFVVGPPRSGTTLTAKILGRHPKIFMPGETHFFEDVFAQRKALGDIKEQATCDKIIQKLLSMYHRYDEEEDQLRVDKLFRRVENLQELRASCDSYKDLFSSFMRIQMADMGKKRWGNNTPRDIFYIDEIYSFFPEARVIVSVRDPRDFLISYKERWRTASETHVSRIKKLYHPIVTTMLWKASVRRLLNSMQTGQNNRPHVVKYERLVNDPEGVVRELCAFVGEDYVSDMLRIKTNNSSISGKEEGIFCSSVGRWKEGLMGEEAYLMQKIAGKEMTALGYKIENVSISTRKVIFQFLTFPVAMLRGLKETKIMRGPLLPYVVRRVKSFVS